MGCGCRGSGANQAARERAITRTQRQPQPGDATKRILNERRPTDPNAPDSVWQGRKDPAA